MPLARTMTDVYNLGPARAARSAARVPVLRTGFGLRCGGCVAAAYIALCVPIVAWAEYRLNPGDVLEISAVGLPDFRLRATVDLDGDVSFPLLGEVKAAGLPLSELRKQIEERLPTKVFRRRTDDGREVPTVISPDEITVVVAEYRPIYLNGDVSKPGEQAYRPGMTVRQAISLAGGYDVMRFRMGNPFLELADLRGEYQSLWTEFAKERSHIWRLEAELGGKTKLDPGQFPDLPIPDSVLSEIRTLEADKFRTRAEDYQREKAYLSTVIRKEGARVATLTEQQQKEYEGMQADAADLERMRELLQRGQVPTTRVTEARRSSLLSSTRLLQTIVQLGQVERGREEFGRRLQKVDDQKRLDIVTDLQAANVRLATLRSRLQAVGDKLLYTGAVRSDLVSGTGGKPEVVIYRKTNGSRERLVVGEETELLPGDVVEVSLHAGLLPEALGPQSMRDGGKRE